MAHAGLRSIAHNCVVRELVHTCLSPRDRMAQSASGSTSLIAGAGGAGRSAPGPSSPPYAPISVAAHSASRTRPSGLAALALGAAPDRLRLPAASAGVSQLARAAAGTSAIDPRPSSQAQRHKPEREAAEGRGALSDHLPDEQRGEHCGQRVAPPEAERARRAALARRERELAQQPARAVRAADEQTLVQPDADREEHGRKVVGERDPVRARALHVDEAVRKPKACSSSGTLARSAERSASASWSATVSGAVSETAEVTSTLSSIVKKAAAQSCGSGRPPSAAGKTSNASAVPPIATSSSGRPAPRASLPKKAKTTAAESTQEAQSAAHTAAGGAQHRRGGRIVAGVGGERAEPRRGGEEGLRDRHRPHLAAAAQQHRPLRLRGRRGRRAVVAA